MLSENHTIGTSISKRDSADRVNMMADLCKIIDSTIYELLNIFQQEISLTQLPVDRSLSHYVELLRALSENGSGTYNQYSICLNSDIDEVRTIQIVPGSEDDQIECQLIVQNISDDGVQEALSYVWAENTNPEIILVERNNFETIRNLGRILRHLRYPAITRKIWIDATCINQSDPDEKAAPVALMSRYTPRLRAQ
ncbi:hypothetical protein F5Y14DRAFT_457020 [Nemania sp. NC0429]|nr:hypothetical protein F5Y14DRAFT_457020 [Nemania sp. NC0429]